MYFYFFFSSMVCHVTTETTTAFRTRTDNKKNMTDYDQKMQFL